MQNCGPDRHHACLFMRGCMFKSVT